jgi:hypothetical protein
LEAAAIDEVQREAIRLARTDFVRKTFIESSGDSRTPFTAENFTRRIYKKLELPVDGPVPGFRRYESVFRDRQLDHLFSAERGAIPADEKFGYYVPCTLAHPGLCAEDDASFLRMAKSCTKVLQTQLTAFPAGSFHYLRFVGPENWHVDTWLALGHFRLAGPKVAMFASCTFCPDSREVSVDFEAKGYTFIMDVSVIGLFFKQAGLTRLKDLQVFWSPAAHDRASVQLSPDIVTLVPSWLETQIANQVCIFPAKADARRKIPVDADAKRMKRSLEQMLEPKEPAVRAPGVAILLPMLPRIVAGDDDVPDGPEDGASEASSFGSKKECRSERSGDSDDGFEGPVAPSPAEDEWRDGPDDGDELAGGDEQRPVRGRNWGPFKVAEVYREGLHIGWGGTCRQHANSWDTDEVCKRSICFGRNTSDETRCLVKQWLLMGVHDY